MTDLFHRLTQLAQQSVGHLKVRSALNPCLWLCGLCLPLGIFGAINTTGKIQNICISIAVLPICLFMLGFIYFMFKDPNKLRSEDFEIRKHALSLIEEKGGRIPIKDVSIDSIVNPDYNLLEDKKETKA